MILRQFQNAVPNAAAEGAEIAGICTQGNIGKPVDDGIEALFEEREDLAFASAVLIGGNHIVLRLIIQDLYHIAGNFGSLLQVRIDQRDIFTVSLL